MNFANFIPAILGILGLHSFNKVDGKESLTADECATLKGYGFSDRFLDDFKAYLANPEASANDEANENKQVAVISAVLGQATSQLQARTEELDALKATVATDKKAHAAAIQAKEAEIAALQEKVNTLSAMPEPDAAKAPAGSAGAPAVIALNLDDDKQLGGLPGEMFALSRPYNQRAKAAMLASRGVFMGAPMASSADFSTLREDLGAFYRRPWQERLQSFLVELPSITSLFPTESGHQDLDTLVNLWLGEFSQADNTQGSEFDKVAKGSYEFGTETLRMYDVMFVHRFQDLKVLEKSWIGYLNREGSNALKLSFIEFLLVETSKQLHNERELRRVNGIRKEPDPNKPGRAMAAADGLYEYLRKRIEGHTDFTPNGGTSGKTVYQIKPFDLPRITPGNIGEVFYLGTGMIPSVFRDTGKIVLYVPSFMIPWYHKYNETHYGQNRDYVAGINYVKEFPAVKIEAIPNADNHHRIFWTIDGNIHTYDHVAGEMLRFNLEQQDWSLKAWSEWKEGLAATAVGKKFTNPADMDGSTQLIWANNYDRPDTYFIDGEPGANPSALLHSSILMPDSSSAYEVTDIEDAEVGKVITLKAAADDVVSIKKAEKFSLITADWKPKKGDTIRLMKRADGKFVEISRATTAADSYQFDDDATTPSLAGATVFITGENTKATAITDFTDAIKGVVYTIHGNGKTNASTIANGGKFVLTAALTLEAGKYIKLTQADDGKFYEIARG